MPLPLCKDPTPHPTPTSYNPTLKLLTDLKPCTSLFPPCPSSCSGSCAPSPASGVPLRWCPGRRRPGAWRWRPAGSSGRAPPCPPRRPPSWGAARRPWPGCGAGRGSARTSGSGRTDGWKTERKMVQNHISETNWKISTCILIFLLLVSLARLYGESYIIKLLSRLQVRGSSTHLFLLRVASAGFLFSFVKAGNY